jgi:hypothetical protein
MEHIQTMKDFLNEKSIDFSFLELGTSVTYSKTKTIQDISYAIVNADQLKELSIELQESILNNIEIAKTIQPEQLAKYITKNYTKGLSKNFNKVLMKSLTDRIKFLIEVDKDKGNKDVTVVYPDSTYSFKAFELTPKKPLNISYAVHGNEDTIAIKTPITILDTDHDTNFFQYVYSIEGKTLYTPQSKKFDFTLLSSYDIVNDKDEFYKAFYNSKKKDLLDKYLVYLNGNEEIYKELIQDLDIY